MTDNPFGSGALIMHPFTLLRCIDFSIRMVVLGKISKDGTHLGPTCMWVLLGTILTSIEGRTGNKNQGVFVKHYAPGGNKFQKAILIFKVKVKVTRSLTLVSFERASLVEHAC